MERQALIIAAGEDGERKIKRKKKKVKIKIRKRNLNRKSMINIHGSLRFLSLYLTEFFLKKKKCINASKMMAR